MSKRGNWVLSSEDFPQLEHRYDTREAAAAAARGMLDRGARDVTVTTPDGRTGSLDVPASPDGPARKGHWFN